MSQTSRTGRRLLGVLAATSLAATAMGVGATNAGAVTTTILAANGVTTVNFQAGKGLALQFSPCPQAVGQLTADITMTLSQNGVSYTGPVHASATFTSSPNWSCGGLLWGMLGSLTQASFQGSNALGDTISCDASQTGYAFVPIELDYGYWGLYLNNCLVDGQPVGTISDAPAVGSFELDGAGVVTAMDTAANQVTGVVLDCVALNEHPVS